MGTVSKAMSLLALFNEDRVELGLSEISRIAKIDKATAHRSLTALRDAGLLEQFGPDKLYRIGPEVLRLANAREAAVPFLSSARRGVETLCKQVEETTHVSLLQGKRLINVAYHYSRKRAIGIMMGGEGTHPLHATSSGLAVLSYAEPALVKSVLSKPLDKYTDFTLTDKNTLIENLAIFKTQGYAESMNGFEEGVHSFSAPIFDRNRWVIGAISIAAPTARIGKQEEAQLPQHVMQAAAELTHETGGHAPQSYPISFFKSHKRAGQS